MFLNYIALTHKASLFNMILYYYVFRIYLYVFKKIIMVQF